jgi:hypothetical protein
MMSRFSADEESRLGLVVFHGDLLHGCGGEPLGERADAGRIAAKKPVGEGIDLVSSELHGHLAVSGYHKAAAMKNRLE